MAAERASQGGTQAAGCRVGRQCPRHVGSLCKGRARTLVSTTSELIASIFCLRTLLGPVVDEYMRTTSWISLTWFWMRPTWPRKSEVVTLMSAAGPAASGPAVSTDGDTFRRVRCQGLRRTCGLHLSARWPPVAFGHKLFGATGENERRGRLVVVRSFVRWRWRARHRLPVGRWPAWLITVVSPIKCLFRLLVRGRPAAPSPRLSRPLSRLTGRRLIARHSAAGGGNSARREALVNA